MNATIVIVGSSALRSACEFTTVRSRNPIARATRTYSMLNSSSRLARTRRVTMPTTPQPRMLAGRMRCITASRKFVQSPASSESIV